MEAVDDEGIGMTACVGYLGAHMRTGTCKVLRMGVIVGIVWRSEALGTAPSQ